ncbi:hypothetical protein N9D23_05450 [Rubripirellula sp.]|nr:hypothetical protein [Rubripirellula sp.]
MGHRFSFFITINPSAADQALPATLYTALVPPNRAGFELACKTTGANDWGKRLGQTTGANDWGQRAVTAESLATPSDEQPTISWESVRAGTHFVGSGMRQDADLRSVELGWRLAL